jgi:RNA polymerase sigma-70 factor (ECF subfamily)
MNALFTNNENTWIKKLKNGDKKAFEVVFEHYKNYLYLFIRKALPSEEDPEGIVQEVFISLWLSRDNLDENKPLKPWLFTIAKNQIYDHLRKIYSKRKYLDSLLSDYSANADSAANEVEYWEFERYLSNKISQLPERRREIFKLSKLEGKSYREIASLLKISENTVDMQMRSANSTIYQAIKQYLAYLIIVFPDIWQRLW